MSEDLLAPYLDERFGRTPTPPPAPALEPDTAETIERRRRVLEGIPDDEWPGWEAT